jgi:UDP-N-acetylmuramoyl-L-alanyl-D-glutamate--2,6-diaminopimelate ligase
MIRPVETFEASLADAAQLVGASLNAQYSLRFSGVTHRDSDVEPGDLFFAIPGAHVHGATFAQAARDRGAVAVVTDTVGAALVTGLPTLVVNDVRSAAAVIASSLYRYPTRDMQSIAITGTNGKTTVSTLLYEIFEAAGRDTGLIGTVETRIGRDVIPSTRTTPEASELQALAATMRERHLRHLVMEVSSHALALQRIKGSHFSIAAFTNLSQDHLDFHHDMESYFATKATLFTSEYCDQAFINIDSEYGKRLAEMSSVPVITVSRNQKSATWHFSEVVETSTGAEFSLRGSGGILIESRTQLQGRFNLDNLLLAIAIAHECGIDPVELASVTPQLLGAPGRLEAVSLGQSYKAIVDYAHSPDAVANVLTAAREFTAGKIIAVLGCGGDRDHSKRPLMGAALVAGSDVAIFTSDNPRSESPSAILGEMVGNLSIAEPSRVIEERAAAIGYATSIAKSGDTVLILGKGHENGQEIQSVITPFDDRIQLAKAIEGTI